MGWKIMWRSTALIAVLTVATCSEPPSSGTSVMALPSTGKTFASFQQDDAACKSYAAQLVGPVATSADTLATAPLLGTALGAGAGAALRAVGGAAGAGAAIGGATGLIAGAAGGPITRKRFQAMRKPAMIQPTPSACTPKGISCKHHLDVRTGTDLTIVSRTSMNIRMLSAPGCSVLASLGFTTFTTNLTNFITTEGITAEVPVRSD